MSFSIEMCSLLLLNAGFELTKQEQSVSILSTKMRMCFFAISSPSSENFVSNAMIRRAVYAVAVRRQGVFFL
ncbi:MAG: hypothetical protein ACLRW3_09460, partial [Eubacterium sp.]